MLHLRVRPGRHSGASALDNQHHGGDGGMDVAQKSGNLLRTPMAELMDRVNERRVIERSLAMEAMETCDAEEGSTSVGPERDRGGDFHGSKRGNGRDSVAGLGKGVGGFGRTVLWVDKYAPNGFRDLLSDERINREVLRAVKTWDHFVFKKASVSVCIALVTHKRAVSVGVHLVTCSQAMTRLGSKQCSTLISHPDPIPSSRMSQRTQRA